MLELMNLTKAFDKKVILLNMNVTFKNGNINILMGKNGIGKSTLLDCIVRPYYLDNGQVLLNGEKINTLNARKDIFYLPSYTFMEENITAIDYLNFISYIYTDRDFQIEKYREEIYELNLKNSMDNLIDTFSVGMKKKLYFLASIVSCANHLIFDELLDGIDKTSTGYILKKLKCFKDNDKCVVLSTHNIELIKSIADKIFEFKNKHIIIENGIDI